MIKRSLADVSVVITAHKEGLMAHKTVLSLLRSIEYAKLLGLKYEIVVSVDNGDEATKNYFNRYKDDPVWKILNVEYGDVSQARNNAVKNTRGGYVALIDADDLISENWLKSAHEIASAEEDTVVHPEYSITFGGDNLIWRKQSSDNKTEDTLRLVDNNLWDMPCYAPRQILINHPYPASGSAFGFEDKHFSCETLSSNIRHIVAPKTILFVRRKTTNSVLLSHTSESKSLAPSKLFEFDNIKSLSLRIEDTEYSSRPLVSEYVYSVAKRAFRIALPLHKRASSNSIYNYITKPLQDYRKISIQRRLESQYPKWMINEWRAIHKIDNSIFPSKALLLSLNHYDSNNKTNGVAYTRLVQSFSKKPDTLFFVPHLIKGGADKLFINYSNTLSKIHSDWSLAVLQTEPKNSLWQNKLSNVIDFINLDSVFEGIDYESKQRLLSMLVVQNHIKRIIIGNSQLAYDFVHKYRTTIEQLNITIYCYAFGEEFDEEGRLWGHIHTGIPQIYPSIYRVITDNETTVNKLVEEYGFDRNKFRAHFQPTDITSSKPLANKRSPIRILWASRVCKQKRPDILKAVSNKLNPELFTIDAWGQLEEGLTPSFFDDSRVSYKGPFDGINAIPTKDYDIYLYTSEGDGIPNVLQEITAMGLPIVASNVGGVGEFVQTDKTGLLVVDHENTEDYISAINQLADHKMRERLNQGAQDLLEAKFSKQTWLKSIEDTFDK